MREHIVAWAERREATTLSRILESVRRRTITLKEEGESYEGLPPLVEDNTKRFLEGGRVISVSQQGVQEGRKECGLESVHRLPHRVRDVVGARGGGVRGFAEGP